MANRGQSKRDKSQRQKKTAHTAPQRHSPREHSGIDSYSHGGEGDRPPKPAATVEHEIQANSDRSIKYNSGNPIRNMFWRGYSSTEKFTLILTVFTVLYAVCSIVQLYEENNPIVGLDPIDTRLVRFSEGTRIEFILGLRNAGKSSADNMSLKEIIGFEKPGERLYWEKLDDLGEGDADLLPGTEYLTPVYGNFLVTSDMIDQTKSGSSLLIVMGRYKYSDIFGLSHTREFCEVALPDEGRLAICPNKNFAQK